MDQENVFLKIFFFVNRQFSYEWMISPGAPTHKF